MHGNEDWSRKGGGQQPKASNHSSTDPRLVPLPERDDEYLTPLELAERYANYPINVPQALAKLNHNAINYTLVVETIAWLSTLPSPHHASNYLLGANKPDYSENASELSKESGVDTTSLAVLVFLPGIKEITTLHEMLLASPTFRSSPAKDWVLPIHSTIPPEEQRLVFARPPKGVRKVVLATNIAETAITIDDVAFVVDTGRMKENRFDPLKRMSSLDDCLVSRANARQRRGRAGRVRAGVAVHLFTRHRHSVIAMHAQPPEVQRVPLEQLVLRIKALKYPGTAAQVCARLIEPPAPLAVQRAIDELKFLEALTVDAKTGTERMTALGVHLSALPVDCRIGKLILLGAMFGVTNDALTIAATLSYRSPFLSPVLKREEADAAKMTFATAQSDHLTIIHAYNKVDAMGSARYSFCQEHFLSIKTLQTIAGLKRQFLELLSAAGFVRARLRSRAVEALGRRNGGTDGVILALQQGLEGSPNKSNFPKNSNSSIISTNTNDSKNPKENLPEYQNPNNKSTSNNPAVNMDGDRKRLEDNVDEIILEEEGNEEEENEDTDGAEEDGEENTRPILKAILAAALFPQMVIVEDGKGGGKKGGGKGQPSLRTRASENGDKQEDIALHPSSVAGKFLKTLTSKYLVYHERVKTTRVYIRDATPVSPYALILFGGGSIEVENSTGSESIIRMDGWLGFKCPRRDHSLVMELREVLDGIMRNKIENPRSPFCGASQGIIGAVKAILEMDEDGKAVAAVKQAWTSGEKQDLSGKSALERLMQISNGGRVGRRGRRGGGAGKGRGGRARGARSGRPR